MRTFAFAAVLAAGACGYTFGSGLDELGIRTVAVQVVGNDSYRQRLEAEISRYLARELPVTTDLVLADAATADATLEVVLTETRERTIVVGTQLTFDPSSPPTPAESVAFPRTTEGALEGAIVLRLVGRDGRVRLERQLLDRTEYRATIGEDVTTARGELAEDLARKIALALENDF
jgi:hypothetical protein